MRVTVVDNHDSFTGNLVEELRRCGALVTVQDVSEPMLVDADAVIISPGPGRPRDEGLNAAALDSGLPVLGVCLGHQIIATRCGGRVEQVNPVHGRTSPIRHDGTGLFHGLPQDFGAVRYHSLAVTEVPEEVIVTALAADDSTIQALQHREKPWWGVQFHAESAGGPHARQILANFLALAGLPQILTRAVATTLGAEEIFQALYADSEASYFLDDPHGFTAMGTGPWSHRDPGEITEPTMQTADLPFDFRPGLVVALEYEGANEVLAVEAQRAMVVGHGEAHLVGLSDDQGFEAWCDEIKENLDALGRQGGGEVSVNKPPRTTLFLRDSREAYLAMIAAAQERIRAGDTYEVCLTTQWEGEADRALEFTDYIQLRRANPGPRGGYLRFGDVQMLSTSPELFLGVKEGRVWSKPIKGTRPANAEAAELADNPKDRAENLMIVDLVRHDLTQVAQPGTVQVDALFEVESYATVHQLVSTISAQLAGSPWQAVRAAFPGGSMTGAPKKSTMAIIKELESGSRGLYSGAFGFVGGEGSVQLTMTIRTVIANGTRLSYGVGGAVLAVSDPVAEWEEILVKAAPLRNWLGESQVGELS